MRKMLLAVATLLVAACANRTSSPAADQAVPTAAAAQAVPAVPAARPKAEQKAGESMKVAANSKKTTKIVNVAKTTQQKVTQQKSPVTENVRKDGPG
jgi:hypothetical protein